MPSSRLLWTATGVAILTAAIYAPVTQFEFVTFDDPLYVGNPVVSQGLSWHGFGWAFATGHASNWHPVTWLSHMVDVQLYGMNAGAHHVTNVLLHVANALMLFFLLFRMTRAIRPSAFVAVLFAVHPLHVESVAWVAERKDVLSAFFAFLTMWAYLAYVARPGLRRYLAVAGCFAIGLMAKPMLVTLPLVLLLLDFWPLGRISSESSGRPLGDRLAEALPLVREKVPLLAMSTASCVVTLLVQREGGAMRTLARVPFGFRLENATLAYVEYLAKAFWPTRLSVLYPYPDSISALKLVGAISILAAVTVAALLTVGRRPYLLIGWLWFVGMLVPVIGLVQVGGQAMADRYTYIPLVGIFIMAAWGLHGLPPRVPRPAVEAIGLVGVLLCAFQARAQVQHWSDGETLWRHAVELAPNDPAARNNLGVHLADRDRIPEALEQYIIALRLKPDFSDAHYNLGSALLKAGRVDDAIVHFDSMAEDATAPVIMHNDIGVALAAQKRFEDAHRHFAKALALDPNHYGTHLNLARALTEEGRLGEAADQYSQALRLQPDDVEVRKTLGVTLIKQGRTADAVEQLSRVLLTRPDDPDAHNNLGVALSAEGRMTEAVSHFSAALRLRPGFTEARNNLARAQGGGR